MNFPLYKLPSCNWIVADKVLFLEGLVLDERNMPGKTLGIRRLQCGRRDLFKLKKAVMDVPSLLHAKCKFFIDSKGMPFIYEKTYSAKLKCFRIKKVERKGEASLLWLYDVPFPITLPRPPLLGYSWARMLLRNGEPWLLYDYVDSRMKETYRRI